MFNFLRRFFRNSQADAAESDIDRFLKVLKGMDEEEKAMAVVLSALMREKLNTNKIPLDESLETLDISKIQYCQQVINRLINKYQQQDRKDLALGLMIWLHSLRAFRYPEIRHKAKSMWSSLKQAFDSAYHLADSVQQISGLRFQDIGKVNFRYIPVGLEAHETENNIVGDNDQKYENYISLVKLLEIRESTILDDRVSTHAFLDLNSEYSAEEAAMRTYLFDIALMMEEIDQQKDGIKAVTVVLPVVINALGVFKEWKDQGLVREDVWKHETMIIYNVANIAEEKHTFCLDLVLEQLQKANEVGKDAESNLSNRR